jgi:hypothetical protein
VNQFRIIAASVAAVSALTLGGCAPEVAVETPSATPTPSVSVDPFGPKPDFFPEGTAVDNRPLFDWVLGHTVLIDAKDPGRLMVKALIEAGFNKAAMQLTSSISGTGNPADSVIVTVQFGNSCLMGQRMLDKSYSSAVESALKSGGCLVGKTRKIEW